MYAIGTIGFYIAQHYTDTFDRIVTIYDLAHIKKVIEHQPEQEPNKEIERMMRGNRYYDHTLMR